MSFFMTFLTLISIVVLLSIFIWSIERTIHAFLYNEFNDGVFVFCFFIGVLIGAFLGIMR